MVQLQVTPEVLAQREELKSKISKLRELGHSELEIVDIIIDTDKSKLMSIYHCSVFAQRDLEIPLNKRINWMF